MAKKTRHAAKENEIIRPFILRLEDFCKLSKSSLRLGKGYRCLRAYAAGILQGGKGARQIDDPTPPWLLCDGNSWPDLYSKLVELEKERRITWPIIVYPAKGKMRTYLRDNLGGELDHLQAALRAKGIEKFSRDLEIIATYVSMGTQVHNWRSRGGKATAEELSVPSRLKRQWQEKAEKIWRKNSHFSVRTVAKLLSKGSKYSPHTIRKYLKKPER